MAPKIALNSPHDGLQGSFKPPRWPLESSGLLRKPCDLLYKLHLPMMLTILTLISLDHPQAIDLDRPQDLQNGLKMAPKRPKQSI